MSRSFKRVPTAKDYSRGKSGTRKSKRIASKAVRNYEGDIPNGKAYRKVYCSWNIFDYKYRCWDKNDEWYKKLKRK